MTTVLLLALTAALVAAGVVMVYARHHRRPVAIPDLPPGERRGHDGEPMTLDLAVAIIRDLGDRLTLSESFNRRLNAVVSAVVATVGVMALIVVILIGVVFVQHQELDQRDQDRVERTVAACVQDNQTGDHVNAGNLAKTKLADALQVLQEVEIDGILAPVVANPAPSPGTQEALTRYQAGRKAVEEALADARAAIAAAFVPPRVCTPAALASSASS